MSAPRETRERAGSETQASRESEALNLPPAAPAPDADVKALAQRLEQAAHDLEHDLDECRRPISDKDRRRLEDATDDYRKAARLLRRLSQQRSEPVGYLVWGADGDVLVRCVDAKDALKVGKRTNLGPGCAVVPLPDEEDNDG